MSKRGRWVVRGVQVAAVAVALTVAGCAADSSEGESPESVSQTGAEAAAGAAAESSAGTGEGSDAASESTTAGESAGATGPGSVTSGAGSSAAAGDTITLTDAQDRSVEVPVDPEVVVALDWSVIRTLNDLGVEVDAVPEANGSLPDDLSAMADLPTVGTLFEPDYEAISAMDPDVVFVGSRSGNPEVVAELERITPAVLDMSVRWDDPADQLDATEERVLQIASVFGETEQAQQRMDAIRSDIEQVAAKAADSGLTTMFVQVSGGTVGAYGPGSRFGLVYADLGFAPIDAPLDSDGSHGDEISQEFFTEYNPGVVFVLDRAKAIGSDEKPAIEVLNNDLVNATDAAKNNLLIDVDGFSWYLATAAPSSLEQMVADAGKAF